ncbi:exodeoxyribonuclease III [Sphingomicrobium sediminis]|uniref:Exodeoxyribonuclease III n=1 Tax=Sphingomicrobium sediminis TaxID=2950949 RepID=A0A9X2EJ82_9SPHN|nr:exodeoxyribonuclease III [Sphingomicrobium sediminis]MCM8558500.1 exodeoxyribonuclease III [Sphingomicrobium sediminis]
MPSVVSFNINGIRARLPRLVEYLEKEQPDIVCLQELKAADDAIPTKEIEEAGYKGVWHGQKGFNGVAILAKGEEPELVRKGLPDDPNPDQSRYIEADVKGLRVASIYLPNGNPIGTEKFDYKLAWMEQLRLHASELFAREEPTVLAGDYNVIPEDRDTYSVKDMAKDALMQPESREALRRIVHAGWTDALRALHPDAEKLYTFWDYQRGAWPRDAGFRIDHLLCSPRAADRLIGAGVHKWARGEEKASDHAPVWASFAD